MAKLNRIADVVISLGTTAITERSFNDMLILGSHVLSTTRALVITGADELLDLGLPSTDPLYFAARDAFSQIPAVRQVYIGRRQTNEAKITVNAAAVTAYSVALKWRDIAGTQQTTTATYPGLVSDTTTLIASGLAAAINATAAPFTAAAVGAVVTITNDVAGAAMALQVSAGDMTMALTPSTETTTDALAAVNSEMENWYGLVITSRDTTDVKNAAAWAEANEKLFGTASSDPNVIDSGSTADIATELKNNQYFRTFVMFSEQAATQYPEAALMSNRFTYYAGAESWSNVQMAGITISPLSEGQYLTAKGKNATTFEMFRNFAVTQGGRVAAGEWIDVIRLRDQLVEQIKVAAVGVIVRATNSTGKVPYTDEGIQLIGNAIRDPLDLNVRRGGIAPEALDENDKIIPSYTITLPRASQVLTNDKANRILRDVKFTARLAGAINTTEIKGSLVYDF
ncbi:DUF3383 family protein [Paracandidimonas lactea]|uniref:DUF3383 family protein n=1 Tax=Paracandidimonas lactea TaxID=2895524 RepID=UPI001F404D20|nr:DUF3383 family protein [Paracandidimonas lactea]